MHSFEAPKGSCVVVALSGGVDSSVTAYILKKQGYKLIGLFMKNWEEEADGVCPAEKDFQDVVQVCTQLDIPYYSVNFSKEYWDTVFQESLDLFRLGYTPNPDVLCNKEIKFKTLFQKARELGGEYLATGHYCQHLLKGDQHFLGKGIDQSKDQSYFLHAMPYSALKYTLFPLGGLKKTEVKKLAEELGFVTASKKESMGICFIGKRKFKPFLQNYLTCQKGNFQTLEGRILGEHDGVSFYTIGQRKGLGIGGPGEAWYVVEKDISKNIIYVAQGDQHPALYKKTIIAKEIEWLGESMPTFPFECQAKIRYRQTESNCTLHAHSDSSISVEFEEEQRAVTPYQSIVFYKDSLCLGGGVIAENS